MENRTLRLLVLVFVAIITLIVFLATLLFSGIGEPNVTPSSSENPPYIFLSIVIGVIISMLALAGVFIRKVFR
ncbi:MAG: hypothetical protein ACXAC8_16960 [Candidatus Hodarchaeales archaeon]